MMYLYEFEAEKCNVHRAEFSARELGLHNGSVCEYGGREVDNNADETSAH